MTVRKKRGLCIGVFLFRIVGGNVERIVNLVSDGGTTTSKVSSIVLEDRVKPGL